MLRLLNFIFLEKGILKMNEEQMEKYLNIEKEIEGVNSRKYEKTTRKIYKRYVLKFARILVENNIQISNIRNLQTIHLKAYGEIEVWKKGRRASVVIAELQGVMHYYRTLNRSIANHRRQHLLDLRILKNYLEGGIAHENW